MPATEEVYRFIHREAAGFAESVRAAAASSHNEAELRTRVAHHIQQLADQLGVKLDLREEYTLAEGQADAVYNRLVIEYKTPGTLRPDLTHAQTSQAIAQMRRYVEGLSREQRQAAERLLGVAIDGNYLAFARYCQDHWNVETPLAVTSASAERLLRALFALAAGRALIPQNLVDDFGARSPLSQTATRALYNALGGHRDDLPARLFAQWQIFFSEVSGYDEQSVRLRNKKELRGYAEGMGLKPAEIDPPQLLFAIHTYFSFLVKAIARLVLERQASGTLGARPLSVLAGLPGNALRHELSELESGGIFHALGLQNLLEGDFFSWYLQAWDENIASALQQVLTRLSDYNAATVQDDPYAARDLLKKLYHYLLPREMRHDLGEYYTPDWLAERVLVQINDPRYIMPDDRYRPVRDLARPKRLLDPACGSGTFLVLAIRALKEHARRQEWDEGEILDLILRSVAGIDLNPLAVLAARVNYLLAVADLLPYRQGLVEIPVYLADSILPPSHGEGLWGQGRRVLKTAVGDLPVPTTVDTRAEMDKLASLLEEYVHGHFHADIFVERICTELGIAAASAEAGALRELFNMLASLEQRGLDGIWARVLKNAFMPLFLESFDYVVGNPPWVNWESLPAGYRSESAYLWQRYGLFVHSGMETILGKGKKDLSTLMTYAVADRFLKDGGKLGFVITQSVFKTTGAGQGFRRFRIGADGAHLRVLAVDDMSELQPFEGASNRTAIFVLEKGHITRYPVPYTYWKRHPGHALDYDTTLQEAQHVTRRLNFEATPVDSGDLTSAWLTARGAALRATQKVLGKSDYQARTGVCTWLNGVYWVQIVHKRPDGILVVRNVVEGAKREMPSVTTEVEPDLVYPMLRGRDVSRWCAAPMACILMVQSPQTKRGIDEESLQRYYPKTYAYLKRFEAPLRSRSGYLRYYSEKDPFYSMFDVGEHTLAPWKVAWTRVATDIRAAVVGLASMSDQQKVVLPVETATMVPLYQEIEAHYVCSILNSAPWRFPVVMSGVHGTGGFGSPNVLAKARVPRFNSADPVHQRLATLSQLAHNVTSELLADLAVDKQIELRRALAQVEAQVDQAAAELWAITPQELAEVQQSLAEMKG